MRGRWLIVALAVSVVLNLALIGFWVGHEHGAPSWAQARVDPSFGLARALRFLPDERREELFGDQSAREIRIALGRSLRGLRAHQRDVNAALTAEPFDADALAEALEAFRTGMGEAHVRNHRLLVDIAANLTAEERGALLRSLRLPRGGSRHGRDGHSRPPPERQKGDDAEARDEVAR